MLSGCFTSSAYTIDLPLYFSFFPSVLCCVVTVLVFVALLLLMPSAVVFGSIVLRHKKYKEKQQYRERKMEKQGKKTMVVRNAIKHLNAIILTSLPHARLDQRLMFL